MLPVGQIVYTANVMSSEFRVNNTGWVILFNSQCSGQGLFKWLKYLYKAEHFGPHWLLSYAKITFFWICSFSFCIIKKFKQIWNKWVNKRIIIFGSNDPFKIKSQSVSQTVFDLFTNWWTVQRSSLIDRRAEVLTGFILEKITQKARFHRQGLG